MELFSAYGGRRTMMHRKLASTRSMRSTLVFAPRRRSMSVANWRASCL
ncbi:hypothetical protein ACQR0V_27435 [Bradyrhizobium sp. HKCCYLS2058]